MKEIHENGNDHLKLPRLGYWTVIDLLKEVQKSIENGILDTRQEVIKVMKTLGLFDGTFDSKYTDEHTFNKYIALKKIIDCLPDGVQPDHREQL